MKIEDADAGETPERFIGADLDGARLDKAVKQHFQLPWAKARAWIDTGKVFIDGNCVSDQAFAVSSGTRIELRMSQPKKRPEPKLDAKAIIYFDEHLVVVNKEAGIMTVPHPESDEEETLDRLANSYLRIRDSGAKTNAASLGVVHRIDKDTSGLVVFARTFAAKRGLSEQFRAHTIERRYLALVHGDLRPQSVRTHLVRDTGEGFRGSVPDGSTNKAGEEVGRLAITHVDVVERLEGATLVSCRIETGRTHQIRIHLSEIGHPIVGEKVYIHGYRGEVIPAGRAMLHAAELGFIHPATFKSVSWKEEPPHDFQRVHKSLRSKSN